MNPTKTEQFLDSHKAFRDILLRAQEGAPATDQTKRDAARIAAGMLADSMAAFFQSAAKSLGPQAKDRALYLALGHARQLGTSAGDMNLKALIQRSVAVAGYVPADPAFHGIAAESFAGALQAGLEARGMTSDRTGLVLSAAELAVYFETASAELSREARRTALRMLVPWLSAHTWSQASKPDLEQLARTAVEMAPYTMVAVGAEVGEGVGEGGEPQDEKAHGA
jgi:hypothetical protein